MSNRLKHAGRSFLIGMSLVGVLTVIIIVGLIGTG